MPEAARIIHGIAGTAQYERHIAAVWHRLPRAQRGLLLTGPQAVGNRIPAKDVIMVGGHQDIPRAGRHDTVYVEHGAGQSYNGDPRCANGPGYSGAEHPPNVRWYISPRDDHARAWGRPAFAAGCPALDGIERPHLAGPPMAVITFHWATSLCPEAGSAIDSYAPHIDAIVAWLHAAGFAVFGHWHPRTPTARAWWRDHDVPFLDDIDRVLERAELMLCDNSSVMYEAAALDIPVIALNSPAYRRDVHHGLRFWDHVPGWQVDSVEELLALDVGAYWSEDWSQAARDAAVAYCYALPPGHAGQAAADWLVAQTS